MKACQVQAQQGNERCQSCDKVQWLEDHMGRSVAVAGMSQSVTTRNMPVDALFDTGPDEQWSEVLVT